MTDMRELSSGELDLVSGGKSVSYHDGFKFTLYDNGDLKISAGGWVGVTNSASGENLEIRTHT